MRAIFLCAVLCVSVPQSISAQVIAPPMEYKAAELGFTYKWFHRDVETGLIPEPQWETAAFYGRFAASDWLTITAEGGSWEVTHDDFPGQEYKRWTVGGGAVARAYSRGSLSVDATVTYNEIYDHDESTFDFDKRTYGWNAGVILDYGARFAGQSVDFWAGPMYVDDAIENYPYGADQPVRSDPENHWGIAAGAYGLFFDHASVFSYVLFLDHPQARVGLALRFGGDTE